MKLSRATTRISRCLASMLLAVPVMAMSDVLTMTDDTALPVSRWIPEGEPERVVLALHGFNDFRRSWESTGEKLREHDIALYAYDQRGFGETGTRGEWAGGRELVRDAVTAARKLRERYPDVPLYLMGESMGAAITMLALAGEQAAPADGGILLAPAVWGRDIQPWYQRLALVLGESVFPEGRVSTEWVNIRPSNDPDTLHYWEEHPLVIREPSMESLAGLGGLMDRARQSAGHQQAPVLMLYGGRDQLVPPKAVCAMLRGLPAAGTRAPWRMAYYPEGWHFLTRDARSEETLADISDWLRDPEAPLPSERELDIASMKQRLCD